MAICVYVTTMIGTFYVTLRSKVMYQSYYLFAVAEYYRQISKLNKHVRDVLSDLAAESDVSSHVIVTLRNLFTHK